MLTIKDDFNLCKSVILDPDSHIFILLFCCNFDLKASFQKVASMIPPSWLSNAWRRHFAGVCTLLLLGLPACSANHHHAPTCTSICTSCRLAQVLPSHWLSTCYRHVSGPSCSFFPHTVHLSVTHTHTAKNDKEVIKCNCPSICLFVCGNSL